ISSRHRLVGVQGSQGAATGGGLAGEPDEPGSLVVLHPVLDSVFLAHSEGRVVGRVPGVVDADVAVLAVALPGAGLGGYPARGPTALLHEVDLHLRVVAPAAGLDLHDADARGSLPVRGL